MRKNCSLFASDPLNILFDLVSTYCLVRFKKNISKRTYIRVILSKHGQLFEEFSSKAAGKAWKTKGA